MSGMMKPFLVGVLGSAPKVLENRLEESEIRERIKTSIAEIS